MYRVGLYTLGCKVSQYETEAVGEEFERRGFKIVPFSEPADVYIINTCTVTAESDRKSRQVIRRAKKTNPEALIFPMGCYTQRAPDEVLKIDGVTAVIGTENKLSVAGLAETMLDLKRCGKELPKAAYTTDVTKAKFEDMHITRAPRTRAYLKIEDGCESKCTYCAIAAARGRVRSKSKDDVIREVEALSAAGVREIVLVGIEVAAYGRDFAEKYDLADLICELDRRGSCERLRLGSLAPELIDRDFVSRVSGAEIFAPHFHLSLQSGSDSVLRGMKRRYNSKMAMAVIDNIRENIPRATFTTDLMVGFPDESDENFLETVDFVRRARLLDAHVFAYSRRDGTPAAYYGNQIPECIKKKRSEILIGEKNSVRDSLLSELVLSRETLSAIAETRDHYGYYTAHSDTYVEIKFKSDENLVGEMVSLVPVSHKDGIVYAELLEK